jgi:hypothetical protein
MSTKLMVQFPLDEATAERYTSAIDAAVDAFADDVEGGGAGAGFGMRDMDWEFADEGVAGQALAAVEALDLSGVEAWLAHDEPDEHEVAAAGLSR